MNWNHSFLGFAILLAAFISSGCIHGPTPKIHARIDPSLMEVLILEDGYLIDSTSLQMAGYTVEFKQVAKSREKRVKHLNILNGADGYRSVGRKFNMIKGVNYLLWIAASDKTGSDVKTFGLSIEIGKDTTVAVIESPQAFP